MGMRDGVLVSEPGIEGQALIASLLMRHRTELFAYLIAAVRNAHDVDATVGVCQIVDRDLEQT